MQGFRDSVPVRKMQLLLGYAKNSSSFSSPSKRYKAITGCQCKQSTSKSFQTCLYLFKLYIKSIIMFLTNDLTNICDEISKNRFIF